MDSPLASPSAQHLGLFFFWRARTWTVAEVVAEAVVLVYIVGSVANEGSKEAQVVAGGNSLDSFAARASADRSSDFVVGSC